MTDYLIDCNHLSAALRKVSKVRDKLQQSRRNGDRLICCYPVLCELEAGIQQTASPDENRVRLTRLLRHIHIWPLDMETTRHFGAVHIELRRLGRVLSQVDMILAALAREFKLTVLSTDRDFEAVTQIGVENWLADA